MARFNKKGKNKTLTTNLAGGVAYSENPKLELASILLTSFANNQYYRSADNTFDRVIELLSMPDMQKFGAKASIYGRTKFGMRSISHVVAGELAKTVKGLSWAKRYYDAVVYRPDDITEILSYYLNKYGKPLPNSLKKGLAKAFAKFNAYNIAKYRGENKDISLIDAVNLLHPKQPQDVLKKLMKGELKSNETWESKLSDAGKSENKEQAKADAWKSLIAEKKIGLFALLRNLRNIIEQAPDMLEQALEQLTIKEKIKKSLVLPFRFTTAIQEIEKCGYAPKLVKQTIRALNRAVDISLDNVPDFEGRTLIAVDVSGSMEGKPLDIASLFGAILAKKIDDSDVLLFSDQKTFMTINPDDSTLSIANRIKEKAFMSGTDFHLIFQHNNAYDRIIILSDMQGWVKGGSPSYWGSYINSSTLTEYKKKTNCDPLIYSFDLQGYGTLQFPERNVYCLAGFSDKIFDVMKLLEQDKQALISEIEKVEF